jgi:hypothetical protein
VIRTTGYEMFHPTFPEAGNDKLLRNYITKGVRNDLYSKPAIFSPKLVEKMQYEVGCHSAVFEPIGSLKYLGDNPEHVPYTWHPVKPWPPLIVQHTYTTTGNLTKECEMKLLHYRFMGPTHIGKLWKTYLPRMSDINKQYGWDRHCYLPESEQSRVFNLLKERSVLVPGI